MDTNYVHITNNSLTLGKGNPNDPLSYVVGFPSTNAVLQPNRRTTYSPTTLGSTVKSYTGTLADIDAIARYAADRGYSFTTENLPANVYKIELTLPYDEITNSDGEAAPTPTFEIVPTIVARDIFEAGIYDVRDNSFTQRYTVPLDVRNSIKAKLKNHNLPLITNETKYGKYRPMAEQFYNLLSVGINTVKANLITVKRSAVYAINNNHVKNYPQLTDNIINPIISNYTLINAFGVTGDAAKQLISSYGLYKTSVILGDVYDSVAYAGYLVGRPTRQYITSTKVQITQEFIFDEWMDGVYPLGSNAMDFPFRNSTPYKEN